MGHTNLSPATLLCCLAPLLVDTITSDTKENTSMSKDDVSPTAETDHPVESSRISFHSLMKILVFLFPDDEICVTTLDGLSYTVLVAIENSDDEENEGSVVYDLSDGVAYGFSPNWMEAFEYVKAGIQEVWFRKMERDAEDTFEGEVVGPSNSDPEAELFSEEAYNREKRLS